MRKKETPGEIVSKMAAQLDKSLPSVAAGGEMVVTFTLRLT